MKHHKKKHKNPNPSGNERSTAMQRFYNPIPFRQTQYVTGEYINATAPGCSKCFFTDDAFSVLLRSMASGCKGGSFRTEDCVALYGFLTREPDGSIVALVTDVVESSPHSPRSSASFDVDHDYAMHRDAYVRDRHSNKNHNLLGYIHSHPGRMHTFSYTDLETFDMYAKDMNVFIAGIITLSGGVLELHNYAVTRSQRGDGRLRIWKLPTQVSNEAVQARLPRNDRPKSFRQIWCEAAKTSFVPRFAMLDDQPAPLPFSQTPTAAAQPAEAPAPVRKYTLDLTAIPEGITGVLQGKVENGVLTLSLVPAQQAAPKAEADDPVPVPFRMDQPQPDPSLGDRGDIAPGPDPDFEPVLTQPEPANDAPAPAEYPADGQPIFAGEADILCAHCQQQVVVGMDHQLLTEEEITAAWNAAVDPEESDAV